MSLHPKEWHIPLLELYRQIVSYADYPALLAAPVYSKPLAVWGELQVPCRFCLQAGDKTSAWRHSATDRLQRFLHPYSVLCRPLFVVLVLLDGRNRQSQHIAEFFLDVYNRFRLAQSFFKAHVFSTQPFIFLDKRSVRIWFLPALLGLKAGEFTGFTLSAPCGQIGMIQAFAAE